MDLQQLRYIVALSRELNFQKAAQSAGISQPTLSQQIKKLEDELQTPLFERSSQRVRITPAGEKFLNYALAALENLQQGVQELQNDSQKAQGKIKLGFIPTIGPYLLPKAIAALHRQAPEVELELHEETTSVLVENLKNGKFDLGLVALPIQDNSLVQRKLGKEKFQVAVAKNHALAQKQTISGSDLKNQSLLILKEGHCFRDQALDFCKQRQKNLKVTFEGSSLVSVMNLAASGEAITFVPQMAAQGSKHQELRFISFCNPAPHREVGVIWRMMTPLSRTQRFFIDLLEKCFKDLST